MTKDEIGGSQFYAERARRPAEYDVRRALFICFLPQERVTLELVAGAIDPMFRQDLQAGLPGLFAAMKQSDAWELVVSKPDQPHSARTP